MYIIDNQQQLERTKEMVPIRKNMETFEVFYHDPATGNLWKSFFPRGYKNHSGPKLLRPEPLPDNLELQLEMFLNSSDTSDAIGLGIECSVKPEKWEDILDILYRNRRKYLRTHLGLFLDKLGVLSPIQSLQELEQNPADFNLTEEQLDALRKRAKWLKIKRFFNL